MLACADGHASLVEGTGNFSRDINSPSPEAQDYFDQGLRLGYGYYFPEAVASFNAALCFDPDNARIHWARAQALGPNANSRNNALPDDPQGEGRLALDRAIANMGEEPQQWKDMINALVPMFDMENLPDMATRSQAVIDSTRALYTQYPDDLEAAFTYTHAIMMASPWYYFEWDGTPRANTNDARAAMEKGMAQNPYHPGLTHLHVHLMEASREPVSAETSADALEPLTPMIGHMAHMPGHIFMRIGRYQDSIDANRRSVLADEYFVQQWGEREYPQYGTYFLSATNHRGHARMFIHWGGLLQGNSDVAFEIVTPLAAATTAEQLDRGNSLRNVSVEWMTYKAFGMWDAILALPAQPDNRPFLQGTLNHVRGAAMAATGDIAGAEAELAALDATLANPLLQTQRAAVNTAANVLAINRASLAGEIANAKGDYEAAIAAFTLAVDLQDHLRYMEPPDWIQSMRLFLGQAYLSAGQPEEARRVFLEDLDLLQENGWALFGLTAALDALDLDAEAAEARERFDESWEYATVELTKAHF
jgi:tetratricopeptide (TPR) repeat protein